MGALISCCTFKDAMQHSPKQSAHGSPSVCLREFSFADVAEATQDFSSDSLVGEGGIGSVYRLISSLPDFSSATKVCIKKIRHDCYGFYPEMKSGFKLLGNLHHPHLVKIHGYCADKDLALVNELVENGNLQEHLFETTESTLSWHSRVKIAYQVASAIEYLHANNVVHSDLKASNVLFDEAGNVKVSDYGIVRLVNDSTQVAIQTLRTLGYLDPDYCNLEMRFRWEKYYYDLFSFGILMVELLTGRRASTFQDSEQGVSLLESISTLLREKKSIQSLVDPRIVGQVRMRDLRKFALIATHSADAMHINRPLISDIVPFLLDLLEENV